jgi:hypothetical protein
MMHLVYKGEVVNCYKLPFNIILFQIQPTDYKITYDQVMNDSKKNLEYIKEHNVKRLIIDESALAKHNHEETIIVDYKNKYVKEGIKYLKHVAIIEPSDPDMIVYTRSTYDIANFAVNLEYFTSLNAAYTWIVPSKDKTDLYLLIKSLSRFSQSFGLQHIAYLTTFGINLYFAHMITKGIEHADTHLKENIKLLIKTDSLIDIKRTEQNKEIGKMINQMNDNQLQIMNFLYNNKHKK